MAKLSKQMRKKFNEANALLHADRELNEHEKEFIFEHWTPLAEFDVSYKGIFFTPRDYALEFSNWTWDGSKIVDLCAGIGGLTNAHQSKWNYYKQEREIICIEQSPTLAGHCKRLAADNVKVICDDAFDLDMIKKIGVVDSVYSNPPFGLKAPDWAQTIFNKVFTPAEIKHIGNKLKSEHYLLFIAHLMAPNSTFILPQGSSPIKYTNNGTYEEVSNSMGRLCEVMGLQRGNSGVTTECYTDQWQGTSIVTEIVDFEQDEKRFHEIRNKVFDIAEEPKQKPKPRPIPKKQKTKKKNPAQLDLFSDFAA